MSARPQSPTAPSKFARHRQGVKHDLIEIKSTLTELAKDVRAVARLAQQHQPAEQEDRS